MKQGVNTKTAVIVIIIVVIVVAVAGWVFTSRKPAAPAGEESIPSVEPPPASGPVGRIDPPAPPVQPPQ